MMIQENMHDAKTHLSNLVRRVLDGDQVVIAKSGTPLVQLVPYTGPRKGRAPGSARNLFEIHSDFDDPLEDSDLENWGL